MNSFKRFYLLSVAAALAAALYPLYMGVRVISDMMSFGTVYAENYPKYIIPYTSIALALLAGVLLMPVIFRLAGKLALFAGSALAVGVFFASEFLLESQVIVTTTLATTLESWQMYMCYVPPEGYATRTWTEVNVLLGEYSPAFKLHFYLISVILLLTLLNCVYGLAKMIRTGDTSRKKALSLQFVLSLLFLGLCILACFTAFFRTGEITVSSLSAVLMSLFFVVFGVTSGVYAGSLFLGQIRLWSVVVPSALASAVTIAMYIGEMVLLSSHLYRFGAGFFFEGLGRLVLAPVDIVVILASGTVSAIALLMLNRKPH